MMLFPKYFITIFLSFAICAESASKVKFKCDSVTFDNCVKRMLVLSDETFIFPLNSNQMNKNCRELKTADSCSRDYIQNCIQGETKNIAKVILYGISKVNRNFCSSSARKTQFVSFGKCGNAHRKEFNKNNDLLNRAFHAIANYKDSKMKIPMLCCNYFVFKRAMLDSITKKCNETEIDYLEALIDSYAADGFNLMCGEYSDDSDRCTPILKKIPKWNKPLFRKVFFLTAIDILDSL